jgi:hypothetical protein
VKGSITFSTLRVLHGEPPVPNFADRTILAGPDDATPDYNFRYTGGQYQFNLKTSGYATGTYLLSFKAGNDPTTHTVEFQVK